MKKDTLRILFYGGLGDCLFLTPSLRSFKKKHPDGQVIVYGSKNNEPVLRHNPYLDHYRWRWNYFPVVAALYYRRTKGRGFKLINYGHQFVSLYHTKKVVEILAENLEVELQDGALEVFLTEQEEAEAKKLISAYPNPVVINNTSRTSPNHEWGLERWAEVIQRLPQYSFLQLGLNDEKLIEGAVDLRAKRSHEAVRQSLAILKHSLGYVGIDTFLSHASFAVGVPAVVLFGDSTPKIWGHENSANIYKGLRCSPCLDILHGKKCPYATECMTAITVDEVVEAVQKQIPSPTGAGQQRQE